MNGKIRLITGLGNKDVNKVKDLVLLWANAGVDAFDMSPFVIVDVQKYLVEMGENLNKFDFCVSIPILGDIHGRKAKINKDKCQRCNICARSCIQKAINPPVVDKERCIGCAHCKRICKFNAIEMYDDVNNDFEMLLKTNAKIDTVELHISLKDKEQVKKQFKKLVGAAKGRCKRISVCFSREHYSNSDTKELLKELKELARGFLFVVQTDGNPMNNGINTIKGTIEAVAFGIYVKSLGYNVILSGGTNEFTAKLAHDAGLECAISYGSYARKLTENMDKEQAIKTISSFISKTKEYLR